ncbi:lytic murein transglycosylase [Jannaschia sp. W003]|uniref:lytic murein transglycosylase n=1 Tax=Jannaschia sp. W003 TaxID=2867012 RepID=UPI0021A898FB|nr:lytic murein transglycosylase [Jannaschia sp. W003]UWQ21440.1 lytic murein transglycosylase [Jannaschia sp. W003]
MRMIPVAALLALAMPAAAQDAIVTTTLTPPGSAAPAAVPSALAAPLPPAAPATSMRPRIRAGATSAPLRAAAPVRAAPVTPEAAAAIAREALAVLARTPRRAAPAALAPAVAAPVPAGAPVRSALPVQRPARSGALLTVRAGADMPVDFGAWLADFRPRALAAGIDAAAFDRFMGDAELLPDVVRRDRNQSEFTKTPWDYLEIAASGQRVANGRKALARHADALARIEARWGVPAEVLVAVWGLETSFGGFRGSTPTISALATLAAEGRRRDFFEAQLLAALRILAAGETTPARMEGSWAGAMGHTQFMPTSWEELSVDWDGDGRRDVWGDDPLDALASAANYLAHHGWRRGEPWGAEVVLPEGFDYALTGVGRERPAAEWEALGVARADGAPLAANDAVSVIVPGGHEGAAFARYPNFDAIEAYNPADAYVIGVGHLADRIAGGAPIAGDWPRQDRALTRDERMEVQALLERAGIDPGGVDGLVGPLTLAAIQRWQAERGLVPDGYAGPRLLERMRK